MMTDPRIGLRIAQFIGALAALWLLGLWLFSDALWAALREGMHAITLISIFLLLTSAPVAWLFGRLASVRADLLAGRSVIARWRVKAPAFNRRADEELSRDASEKRGVLFLILFLIAVCFGGIALFDPRAARGMAAIGAGVCLLIVAAFFLGNWASRERLEYRSGEVVLGERGLLFNDVLHVWGTPFSWLEGVEIEEGESPALIVTYAYMARHGAQTTRVALPFSKDRIELAQLAQKKLQSLSRATG
jgi:hypothetical protein